MTYGEENFPSANVLLMAGRYNQNTQVDAVTSRSGQGDRSAHPMCLIPTANQGNNSSRRSAERLYERLAQSI